MGLQLAGSAAKLDHGRARRHRLFRQDSRTARTSEPRTGGPIGKPLQNADLVWAAAFDRNGDTLTGRGIAYAQRSGEVVAIVKVEIDRHPCIVWAKKFTVAHDSGLIINPDGLRRCIKGPLDPPGRARHSTRVVRWSAMLSRARALARRHPAVAEAGSVPARARRPITPVYVLRFVAFIEAVRANNE